MADELCGDGLKPPQRAAGTDTIADRDPLFAARCCKFVAKHLLAARFCRFVATNFLLPDFANLMDVICLLKFHEIVCGILPECSSGRGG